jgi:hypothetical protein
MISGEFLDRRRLRYLGTALQFTYDLPDPAHDRAPAVGGLSLCRAERTTKRDGSRFKSYGPLLVA